MDVVTDTIKTTAEEILGKKKRERKVKYEDGELEKWSDKQRQLRLDIQSCINAEKRKKMKTERNQILKMIRNKIKNLRMEEIKEKVVSIEKLKDSAKTFQALRELRNMDQKRKKLIVNNEKGEQFMDDKEAAEYVRNNFASQFSDVTIPPFETHVSNPQPL